MISKNIYTANDFKTADSSCAIPVKVLMKNAAICLYGRLMSENRLDGNILIVCGKGNNGGDGYALAEILALDNRNVCVYAIEAATTDAAMHYAERYGAIGNISDNFDKSLKDCDTIVDCIFGFSFKGDVKDPYKSIIEKINLSNKYVLSVDLPSGLQADSDALTVCHIKATVTSTFTAKKLAVASYPAKKACGKVYIEDIGIPFELLPRPAILCDGKHFIKSLPKRDVCGHKGSFGTLAALVGSEFMPGAAYLSCLSALQSGVGLLRLFSENSCLNAVSMRIAEPVLSTVSSSSDILSKKHTALLIGCGCGRAYDSIITDLVVSAKSPIVLDADGINCIAGNIELYRSMKGRFIVTPHEMEMARLLGCDVSYVSNSRLECARRFSNDHGVITVLKGAATIVAEPNGRVYINETGNSGLAKGGSGDVLAGLIASLVAQGTPLFEASALAVYIHGKAADKLEAEVGQYAMLPSMLPLEIGKILTNR